MFPLRLLPPGEADRLRPLGAAPGRVTPLYLPAGAYAVVRAGIAPGKIPQVNALLDQLKAMGVVVVDQRDVDHETYQRELASWHERVMAHMRASARGVIADLKARRVRERRPWVFASDEVEIADDADEDLIGRVLDLVGYGDQFDRLRAAAYATVEQPEPPPDDAPPAGPMGDDEFEEMRATMARTARFRH